MPKLAAPVYLTEAGIARIANRHRATVKRLIAEGDLVPSAYLQHGKALLPLFAIENAFKAVAAIARPSGGESVQNVSDS